MIQIAQNNGRFYRVSWKQFRYFPIARAEAQVLLATGKAKEVMYLPFGRADLWAAYRVSQAAIKKAQEEA